MESKHTMDTTSALVGTGSAGSSGVDSVTLNGTTTVRVLDNEMLDARPRGPYLAIAERNARDSPLLRLPPEVRNRIYRLVLGGKRIDMDFPEYTQIPECLCDTQTQFSQCTLDGLQLLHVCRQTYAETCLLPFSANMFRFDVHLSPWNLVLPAQQHAVRRIQIWTSFDTIHQMRVDGLSAFLSLEQIHVQIEPWFRNAPDEELRLAAVALKAKLKSVCGKGVRVFFHRSDPFTHRD